MQWLNDQHNKDSSRVLKYFISNVYPVMPNFSFPTSLNKPNFK